MRACVVVLLLSVVGCVASEPGEPCQASGSGFTRQDSCRVGGRQSQCLDYPVTCADGSTPTPNVCAGGECRSDGDCVVDWACVQTGSVTRHCVPRSVCVGG